jgi:lipoprotein-anchoring transpeptidase ErfK/SrfK
VSSRGTEARAARLSTTVLVAAVLGVPGTAVGQATVEPDPVQLVVSISQRSLTVRRGSEILHSFPVGVGTGARLDNPGGAVWDFATPIGSFEVGRMKRDPLWYAPDWYYVERGLPAPPAYSQERYIGGVLGDYALYLSDEIAIHGTDRPASVGRASSHGCLRMHNADIAVVYSLVHVGTPVTIRP